MDFPSFTLELRHSPDRVMAAILGGDLDSYFQESGWLTRGGAARWIKWQKQSDNSLVGKLGYFRAKNLSVFRFRVELHPLVDGSKATVLAEHGPYSPMLRFLLYALGLCMCVVGVVFSILGDKIIQRGLFNVVDTLQRHLMMWDSAE